MPRQEDGDIESSDSSVVTRWTVDQAVVDSNPTHDKLKFLLCSSLRVYSAHSVKCVPAFGGWSPPHRAGT